MNVNKKVTFYFSAFLLALGLVVFAGQTPPAVLADGLPPRETPTSGQGGDGNGGAAAGAYIELVAPDIPAGSWAAVLWQDSGGGWHDVEGWHGWIEDSCRWWVHPKDFGSGPFRWVVTQGPGGTEVHSSAPFSLPNGTGQVKQITMP